MDDESNHLLLEIQHVWGLAILGILAVLGILKELFQDYEGIMGKSGSYIIRVKKERIR